MTHADIERWNRKYADANPHAFVPDPLLVANAALLDGKGWALDLACGVGHNAIYLARRGYDVVAVDGSLTALRYCREAVAGTNLRVHPVVADLDRFVLPRGAFAVAIVFRFLDRSLIPAIKQSVAPGGLVIYQTFNVNKLRFAPGMQRKYLLEPGELKRLFSDFETIASNDAADIRGELSYWIGRRPAAPR